MNYAMQRLASLKEQFGEPENLDQAFDLLLGNLQSFGVESKGPLVGGLAWSVSYRDSVSDTHSCPASSGINWGCKPGQPKGYPGYSGRVWVRYNYRLPDQFTWGSDLFQRSQFFTGTGGAGGYDGPWSALASAHFSRYGHSHKKGQYPNIDCYSWDFRFYHDDFPLIRDLWVKRNLFNVVATGKTNINLEQYRVWEDPATAEADKAFMEECKEKADA